MKPKTQNLMGNIKPMIEIAHKYIDGTTNYSYKDIFDDNCDEEKLKQWRKTFDENKEQKNKDFQEAYQATLCECGYDKIKCKIKEVKCDKT